MDNPSDIQETGGLTREEAITRVRSVFNPKLAGEVAVVMDRFSTVSGFLAASRADLLKANRLARPDAKRDLGARFFLAHDDLAAYAKERRYLAEKEAIEQQAREEAEREVERRENPTFTLAQMKSIVSFMELCGVSAIDLKGATEYFRVMKIDFTPPRSKA